tara:strand:- start:4717 stop:5154 length:438 start_codon:yes stop_codon:yes gene_type:complete
MAEDAYLQFFEELPYYVILIAIFGLSIYGLFFNKPGTYTSDGVKNIETNIEMFYLFIWSIYMLIISLFKYLFEGIWWLIYALFQKEEKVGSQGNINKDIFDNEITEHAKAIYTIIWMLVFNILKFFNIRLTWFISTPDYVDIKDD